MRPPSTIGSTASWAGLDDAAWRLPGAAPSDAGGPDWSLLDHVGHRRRLVGAGRRVHRGRPARGPVAIRRRLRGRRLRHLQRGSSEPLRRRPAGRAPRPRRASPTTACPCGRAAAPRRDDPGRRRVGLGPPGPPRPRPGSPDRPGAVGRPAPDPADLQRPVRAGPTADPAGGSRPRRTVSGRRTRRSPPRSEPRWTRWRTRPGTQRDGSDWSFADHVAHLAGWFVEGARALETAPGRWRMAGHAGGGRRRLQRPPGAGRPRHEARRSAVRLRRRSGSASRSAVRADGRRRMARSRGLQLGLRGSARPRPGAPRDDRAMGGPGPLAGGDQIRAPRKE